MGKRKGFIDDRKAQMFILEVLTTGLLIITAINFITALPTPSEKSNLFLYKWSVQGEDALRSLENMPSTDPDFLSRLDQGICSDLSVVIEQLNNSLSQSLSFNLLLVNQTSHITLYKLGIPNQSNIARAYQTTYLTGGYCKNLSDHTDLNEWTELHEGVYEISLVIWFEVRGGGN